MKPDERRRIQELEGLREGAKRRNAECVEEIRRISNRARDRVRRAEKKKAQRPLGAP